MIKHASTIILLVTTLAISLIFISCATTRPAIDAVVSPTNLVCDRCKPLQQKYFNNLLSLANRMPFSMKVNTMGFIDWKDSTYFSVYLIGGHYNTIRTTTTTRLTNEFHEKYQETVRLILKEQFISEVVGVHIVLLCTSTNFVSDNLGLDSKPNTLEIFATTPFVKQFLNGDITAQDLLDKSIVFVDAQRTRFGLEMM
jgi:hypothetical protein